MDTKNAFAVLLGQLLIHYRETNDLNRLLNLPTPRPLSGSARKNQRLTKTCPQVPIKRERLN